MKEIALKLSIPLFMMLAAGWQFYMVHTQQLTRWKGGGFGMYSEMHPQYRQVWVVLANDSSYWINNSTGHTKTWQNKATKLCYRPNKKKLTEFARQYAASHLLSEVTIQVWQPDIVRKDNHLHRVLINEVSYATP
jgi:hypothetical protein